jgi:hypothetical protein
MLASDRGLGVPDAESEDFGTRSEDIGTDFSFITSLVQLKLKQENIFK